MSEDETPVSETPNGVADRPAVVPVPRPSNPVPEPKKFKITREESEKIKADMAKDKGKVPGKPFKWPWAKRQVLDKSMKKGDEIAVLLINMKKQLEGPILTRVYGGNFMVIRHRVYRFNPARVYSMGKYKIVIAKEYDRELVGIDDYPELILRDHLSKNPGARVNIDDPVLIKAIIAARLAEKPQVQVNSKWIIIGLVIVGLAVGAFLLFGKKTPAPVAAPTG